MTDLSEKKCVPCTSGTPPLKGEALKPFLSGLGAGWKVVDEQRLEKEYTFKNFRLALDFVNAVGALAEQEGHHPDVFLTWGKVKLTYWTHKINGLSESDFIMAAKTDQLISA
jgi:4a-hydroxytetrahydrobiopterin dehydratase